jgi:hypothetical protein
LEHNLLHGWRRAFLVTAAYGFCSCLQLGQQLHTVHQQQLTQQREAARRSAAAATQQAKADLQVLKEEQERRRLHAAELKDRLTTRRMDMRLQ